MNLLPMKCLDCGKLFGTKPTLRQVKPGEYSTGYCPECAPSALAKFRAEIETLSGLSRDKTEKQTG